MKLIGILLCLTLALLFSTAKFTNATAANRIFSENISTLQTTIGNDWLSPPVVSLQDLRSGKKSINISFDEMSHDYYRMVYRIKYDDGRLVGCGRHEELLQSCVVYREICESQFGSEEKK